MSANLKAAFEIGMNLIKAGLEVYKIIQNKNDLTAEDLLKIITIENKAQAEAAEKLASLTAEDPLKPKD